MDRRTFLGMIAGSPLVFGLGELLGQEAEQKRPAWFDAALKRMKDKNRCGIAVVAPAAAAESLKVGEGLWDLLNGDHPDAHEIFTGSVFICLTPALAVRCGIRTPDEKENRFLLDPSGKRVAADTVTLESFGNPGTFGRNYSTFLHGDRRERLKARVEAIRAALTPELKSAFEKLESEDVAVRDAATGVILKNVDTVHDLLVHGRMETTVDEAEGRYRMILKKAFEAAEPTSPGPRLPYGSRVPAFTGGACGGAREIEVDDDGKRIEPAPPPPCGMARSEEVKIRMFLRFLTK